MKQHRSRILIETLIFSGLLTAGAALSVPEVQSPNVVLILADDLGSGDVGCYGATKIQTPNIDRLAQEGIRLTDAHTTCSVCQPSRYAILSGRYYWRSTPNPGYSYYFDEGEILLPQLLGLDRRPQLIIEVRDTTAFEHAPPRALSGCLNHRAEGTVPQSNLFFH